MTTIERYNYAFEPNGDAWAARLLRQLPPDSGEVLELGPGPGAMTKVMVDRGCHVTVIENDPGALDVLGALGVNIVAANLDELDWVECLKGRQFDAILACDVLEHLRSPDTVLRALRTLLKPNGRLIISVPNVSYGGIVSGLIQGAFDYTQTGLLDKTHIRFFTRRSMERLLLELGWSPRHWEPYCQTLESSEFAACWHSLPADVRNVVATQCVDFDVYEWMVVAIPSSGVPDAAVKEAQQEAHVLREELQALRLVYEREHASLLDHQKAFGEARKLVASWEVEVKVLRSELEQLRKTQEEAAQFAGQSSWLRRFFRR